jgi:vancomycin resistance protein YoaR
MAGAPVEFREIEPIIARWKMDETPYYSLWQGAQLKFVNESEDEAEAEDKLRQALEQLEQSQTTAIYSLRTHRDNKNFNNKKEYKGSFTFRLNDYDVMRTNNRYDQQGGGVVVINPGKGAMPPAVPAGNLEAKLDRLIELITLQATLNQPEEVEEEEDEEEELTEEELQAEQQQKIQNTIQQVAGIMDVVKPVISQILEFFKPSTNTNSMAGTDNSFQGNNQEKLSQAISILEQALGQDKLVDAMCKIAKMAQENPGKLNNLLMFL